MGLTRTEPPDFGRSPWEQEDKKKVKYLRDKMEKDRMKLVKTPNDTYFNPATYQEFIKAPNGGYTEITNLDSGPHVLYPKLQEVASKMPVKFDDSHNPEIIHKKKGLIKRIKASLFKSTTGSFGPRP